MCGLYSIFGCHRTPGTAESNHMMQGILPQPLTNAIHRQFSMLKVHRLIYSNKLVDI